MISISKEGKQWWVQNLKICNDCDLIQSHSQVMIQRETSRIQNNMGCSMSANINREPMKKGETVVTHKCIGTQSSKISLFDLEQAKNL